ncbi:hypothetical protein [Rhodoplanes sp. Z2-YC6860]|uniref:hypothetical protein n=1 Tax=Rhodoplanes sp. Z2-YC6860 TaxID=674703 RepID=UPI000AED04A6|nr:hypothetical protein [Rhodoplanes sp. Z2-YC6860]
MDFRQAHPAETSPDTAGAVSALHSFQLSSKQSDHVAWLAGILGTPAIWTAPGPLEADRRLVIVATPPTGPQIEQFCRSLPLNSVVVIPFGENPLFDSLKSKLVSYGTIAASGAEQPHVLWWGGTGSCDWAPIRDDNAPLVVSCFDRTSAEATAAAAQLAGSLKALGLDHIIEPISGELPKGVSSRQQIRFIARSLETAGRPILFVEHDSVFIRTPSLLRQVECDVAVHRWRGWEISPRTLYLNNTMEAKVLVQTWERLIEACPTIGSGYLLDQAWSLVSSQVPLRTLWLPRSYHDSVYDGEAFDMSVIRHSLRTCTTELNPLRDFPNMLRTARRAGRTGAPEAHLVIRSASTGHEAAVVVLRDVQTSGAAASASAVRRVAKAFRNDPACFSQIELSLCRWEEDVNAAIAAAEHAGARVVVIEPTGFIYNAMFSDLGRQIEAVPQQRRFRIPPRTAQDVAYLQ